MAEGTPDQIDRVTQAFLPMKKFDLAALRSLRRVNAARDVTRSGTSSSTVAPNRCRFLMSSLRRALFRR